MHWFNISKNFGKNYFIDVPSSTLSECTLIFFHVCSKINFINSFIEFINSDDYIRKINISSFYLEKCSNLIKMVLFIEDLKILIEKN